METIYIERGGLLLKCQVVAEIPPKTCTGCGKTFFLQEGRSEAGQQRTKGVRYCSNLCARAAAQRAWRDRQRAKKAQGIAAQAIAQLGL